MSEGRKGLLLGIHRKTIIIILINGNLSREGIEERRSRFYWVASSFLLYYYYYYRVIRGIKVHTGTTTLYFCCAVMTTTTPPVNEDRENMFDVFCNKILKVLSANARGVKNDRPCT